MEYAWIIILFLIYFISLVVFLVKLIREFSDFEGKMQTFNRTMYIILGISSFIPIFNTVVAIGIWREYLKYNRKKNRNVPDNY